MGGSGEGGSGSPEEDGAEEKKVNCLYSSSLRAVLPATHPTTLSNPATVSRTLNYMPDLQKEVQVLTQRKEELLSSSQASSSSSATSSYSVEAMDLGKGEILIQISTLRLVNNTVSIVPISEVMREVEQEDDLLLMEVSSSESSSGRIFHHLHIKVEANHEINCDLLKEKILNMCQNWEIK